MVHEPIGQNGLGDLLPEMVWNGLGDSWEVVWDLPGGLGGPKWSGRPQNGLRGGLYL